MKTTAKKSPLPPGIVGRFNPSLLPLLAPIEDLREDPDNANLHGERSVEDIAESFRAFGQQKPLVTKKGGTVVAGNGGLRAARKLGWTHVAVVQFDGPSEAARAYAIADNRSAEYSERDEEVLGRQLRELAEAWQDFRPELVGYTEAEASRLPGGYGTLPERPAEGGSSEPSDPGSDAPPSDPDAPGAFQELDENLPYAYECPRCQHRWSGKARQ